MTTLPFMLRDAKVQQQLRLFEQEVQVRLLVGYARRVIRLQIPSCSILMNSLFLHTTLAIL